MTALHILHVASEVAPWCQSGGLADVVGALPCAVDQLAAGGASSVVVAPLYRGARQRADALGAEVSDAGATEVSLPGGSFAGRWWRIRAPKRVTAFLLDIPELYDRDGLYGGPDGHDFPDNPLRFGSLCRAACADAARLLGAPPAVLHAHDWQAGLALLYGSQLGDPPPRRVFTIHNIAHQGNCGKEWLPALGLDWSLFTPDKLEFFDQLSLLKAGVAFADEVTTVSPSYADEITHTDLGFGLTGFLGSRVRGIVNGIDTTVWDPTSDPALPAHFAVDRLDGKRECRAALAREVGLPVGADTLLLSVVSRLVWQKGIDLVVEVAPQLESLGAALVVLGVGSAEVEHRLREAASAHPHRVVWCDRFDVPLSHRVYAGADAVLVPSRFEPCGLTQLYAMRYGAVPIVRATGGLRDTVRDPGDDGLRAGQGNGIAFADASADSLRGALRRAAGLFRDAEAWARIVRSGMERDSSWAVPASEYLRLYPAP